MLAAAADCALLNTTVLWACRVDTVPGTCDAGFILLTAAGATWRRLTIAAGATTNFLGAVDCAFWLAALEDALEAANSDPFATAACRLLLVRRDEGGTDELLFCCGSALTVAAVMPRYVDAPR
jgi:hypothetical protein